MFVTVTNKPELQQALVAWKNSRPFEQNTTIDKILNLDLPVNEFTRINLFIESSLIEREIIATMRNHVIWAQGSRVQDCLKFTVDYDNCPDLLAYQLEHEVMRLRMASLAAAGVRQDDYRLHLPVVSQTRYSISTDLRSVIKLSRYFDNLAFENNTLTAQFESFSALLMDAAISVLKDAGFANAAVLSEILRSFKPYNFLYDDHIRPGTNGRIGSMITVSAMIPFHLRAHVIRHRNIWVKDSLLDFIRRKDIGYVSMSEELAVQIAGSEAEMSEVVSKRSCWIANYKVWGDLLKQIEDNLSKGNNPLPCKDGNCPWNADAMLRVEEKDPNPPCPIHMKLNGITPSQEQIEKMDDMITNDNRSEIFWGEKLKECQE